MILYTIMPMEAIFPSEHHEISQEQLMEYNGVPMLVESVGGVTYEIKRIISTNPEHYMQYEPGQKIFIIPS